ncbi:hypothetical protein ILYODFUR_017252 [Ilyodon furcidens]|uniref:Uncharacterized protein n=1 Tax=Ilyodon furcidens TaxID=33524 RepID=A0ABV0VHR5_9TELE
MTTQRKSTSKLQLRRSISEQLRDSTSKAWDLLWRNVRERRLAVAFWKRTLDVGCASQRLAEEEKKEQGRGSCSCLLGIMQLRRCAPLKLTEARISRHSGPIKPPRIVIS